MIVSLIAAMDRHRGIGKDNQLPWRLPADLKRFRELTTGHHVIAGRKTYESIGKPLPNRTNIIVTRHQGYEAKGCFVVHSLGEALALARTRGETETFVIGGAEIYAQALAVADQLYLTFVAAEVEADTFFPEFNAQEWQVTESIHHAVDEKNAYAFTFQQLIRQPTHTSEPEYIRAHQHSSRHRDKILQSDICGCFYCTRAFPPQEITKWIDRENGVFTTALCPKCGIDSVIGSQSGFPITEEFLEEMRRYWF
jgi:dihydrofolate reductase